MPQPGAVQINGFHEKNRGEALVRTKMDGLVDAGTSRDENMHNDPPENL